MSDFINEVLFDYMVINLSVHRNIPIIYKAKPCRTTKKNLQNSVYQGVSFAKPERK